jgi:hypothetical protein
MSQHVTDQDHPTDMVNPFDLEKIAVCIDNGEVRARSNLNGLPALTEKETRTQRHRAVAGFGGCRFA